MDQRAAAERAGISQTTWQRIESGDRRVKLGDLVGIAHALGTTVGFLAGDSALMQRVAAAARADHQADVQPVEDHLRQLMDLDLLLDQMTADRR